MIEGRWFFAVAPTELPKHPQLLRVAQRLKRSAKDSEWEVKWVPMDQLHLTVGFIGNITEEQRQRLMDIGAEAAKASRAFDLDLKGVSAFPEPEAGRVVWVGVRRTQDLVRLHEALTERLSVAGFPPEREDFVPHITLGRLRHVRHLVNWLSPFKRRSFGEFKVTRLSLFSSHQYGQKIVYKLEGEWDLIDNASFKKETK